MEHADLTLQEVALVRVLTSRSIASDQPGLRKTQSVERTADTAFRIGGSSTRLNGNVERWPDAIAATSRRCSLQLSA